MKQKNLKSNNEKIKQVILLAKQNDIHLLYKLGFKNATDTGIQQRCPVHGGDNPTAFSYDTRRHLWSCFTQHCEKQYGNDIVGLVRALKQCGFADAVRWITENLDIKKGDLDLQLVQDILVNLSDESTQNIFIDELLVQPLSKDCNYLETRGFHPKTIEFFEAKSSTSKHPTHNRVMIPIKNFNGDIVGFTGRSVFEKCSKCQLFHNPRHSCPTRYQNLCGKWRHYPKGFNKRLELYNIHNAKEEIQQTKTAVLTEGPLDVWALWQEKDIKNAIACFGVTISYQQCVLLAKAGCINLRILFDADEAGQKAVHSIFKMTKRFFNVENILIDGYADPGELIKHE